MNLRTTLGGGVRARSDVRTYLLSIAAAVGITVAGCASENRGATSAAPDGGAAASTSPASACVSEHDATSRTVRFSTAVGCEEGSAGACPSDAFVLEATTKATLGGDSTADWTIRRGTSPVVVERIQVAGGVTSADVDFGAEYGGGRRIRTRREGDEVTGTIGARPLRPLSLAKPHGAGGLEFAGGGAVPDVTIDAATGDAIHRLVAQAHADVASSCGGDDPAVSALLAALPAPTGAGAAALPSPAHGSSAVELAPARGIGNPLSPQASGTVAAPGVPPDFSGSTRMNNLDDFASPDCSSCATQCGKKWACELTPFCELICIGECFEPTNGCAENICPVFGIGSCDNGYSCCGNKCCAPGTVCGDPKSGTCCPAADPVACGDETGMTCSPAGSTCCGKLDTACPAGSACTDVSGTIAYCCAPAQTATDGACCAKDTCGGACCDTGTCVNGACCAGPVANGECCPGGLEANVCNGACCLGSCTANGGCCDTTHGATVCGSSCCAAGSVCIDASASACGAAPSPTLELVSPATGTIFGSSQSTTRITISRGETIDLAGLTFDAGPVTVSADTTTGATLATAQATGSNGAATFGQAGEPTVGMNTSPLTPGNHTLVAWQTVGGVTVQASVLVYVQVIQ